MQEAAANLLNTMPTIVNYDPLIVGTMGNFIVTATLAL